MCMDEATLEIIVRWLTKADRDIIVARLVLNQKTPITDVACYHAEQCVERSLNAYLVFRDVHLSETLDTNELVQICIELDSDFDSISELIMGFAEYDIPAQEPDEWREIPLDEALEAVRNAEEVMTFVKDKLRI